MSEKSPPIFELVHKMNVLPLNYDSHEFGNANAKMDMPLALKEASQPAEKTDSKIIDVKTE